MFGLRFDREQPSEPFVLQKMTVLGMTKRKDGETMTSRELIVQADKIRQDEFKGMTQAEWSRQAGLDVNGKAICNAYNRGNCKLSTLIMLLRPLGYELKIEKAMDLEDMP